MKLPDGFPALPDFPPGEVWLAGAGPGDPRLLTVLALHAVANADTVVHDALVDPRILEMAREGSERIFAGKRGGRPSPQQAEINAILIERARAGRRVLRMKGGDPFVFGRGWDEASGLAAAALAGIPATSRDTNHAVILAAGHRAQDGKSAADWEALAKLGQPIILYMPMAQLADIAAALMRGGMLPGTPAAIIQGASTVEERVLESSLATLADDARREGIGAPAIVVIGKIAGLRQGLLPSMVGWQ